MNTQNTRLTVLLILSAALLTACGGLLESDRAPVQTWWLEPLDAGERPARGDWLTINVSGVPGLDTDRILNINRDSRLNHYEGARWPDHAPDLLASVLARSIESTGQFSRVTVRHSRPSDGCHLDLELRQFFARLDGAGDPTGVSLELSGSLDCGDGPSPVRVGGSAGVASSLMRDIVAGFQAALDQATRDLLAPVQADIVE